MKKTEIVKTPIKKRTRAKYPCPGELERVMKKVNLVPFNIDPPMRHLGAELEEQRRKLNEKVSDTSAPETSFHNTADDFSGLTAEERLPSLRTGLKNCLEYLPEDFQKYIKGFSSFYNAHPSEPTDVVLDFSSTPEVQRMANEYYAFFDLRMVMWRYVDRLERERLGEITPLYWAIFPLTMNVTILREADGEFKKPDILILFEKFNKDRLRRCEICSRYFWAKRKQSKTCSPPCFNALRQRRFRQKSQEEIKQYNKKRKENHKTKKRVEKIKEKNNGSL